MKMANEREQERDRTREYMLTLSQFSQLMDLLLLLSLLLL